MAGQHRRAWNPAADFLINPMSVIVPEGMRTVTGQQYRYLLANRVERMIRREGDPRTALERLITEMEDRSLLAAEPPDLGNLFQATQEMVARNPLMMERLNLMGLPPLLGKIKPQFSQEAAEAVRRVKLEDWAEAILP